MAYVVAATWIAEPGKEDVVRGAILNLTAPSREEPGNLYYQAYEDPEETGVFHLFEVYEDQDAYAAHGASDHFAQYGHGQAIPVLKERRRSFYQTIG